MSENIHEIEQRKYEQARSVMFYEDDIGDIYEQLGHIFFSIGVTQFRDKHSMRVSDDPPIPEKLLSGEIARKHVWGRTDLGDYRNRIKNVNGVQCGVTVHVKRIIADGTRTGFANVLTVEDVGGECEVINIVTSSGKKLTVNVGRMPISGEGGITTNKLELA